MKILSYMDGHRELIIAKGISIYFYSFTQTLEDEVQLFVENDIDAICILCGEKAKEFISLNVEFV